MGKDDNGYSLGHHLLQVLGKDRRQRRVVQMALFAVMGGETKQWNKEGDGALCLLDESGHMLGQAFEVLRVGPNRRDRGVVDVVAPTGKPHPSAFDRTVDQKVDVARREDGRDALRKSRRTWSGPPLYRPSAR